MDENRPLVSLIVPIYKVEKYLRTCIESMVRQTYENIEILLVDDGSPDNCGKICDEFAEKDSRIRVFHVENQGVSVARNIGLDNAKGEWVSFIDSDDFLDDDFIEYLVSVMEETGADITYCGYRRLNEEGVPFLHGESGDSSRKTRTFTSEEAVISLFRVKNDFANYIWNGLFRKSITTHFVPGKRTGQDQDFTIQCLLNAKLIARGYEIKYNHIIRPSGARSVVLKERTKNGFNTLDNVRKMLSDYNVSDEILDAFNEKCMRMYFAYMEKYCVQKLHDRELFQTLRSGIKKYTKLSLKGFSGGISSFFLGLSGESIYKAVFWFIQKKEASHRRVAQSCKTK